MPPFDISDVDSELARNPQPEISPEGRVTPPTPEPSTEGGSLGQPSGSFSMDAVEAEHAKAAEGTPPQPPAQPAPKPMATAPSLVSRGVQALEQTASGIVETSQNLVNRFVVDPLVAANNAEWDVADAHPAYKTVRSVLGRAGLGAISREDQEYRIRNSLGFVAGRQQFENYAQSPAGILATNDRSLAYGDTLSAFMSGIDENALATVSTMGIGPGMRITKSILGKTLPWTSKAIKTAVENGIKVPTIRSGVAGTVVDGLKGLYHGVTSGLVPGAVFGMIGADPNSGQVLKSALAGAAFAGGAGGGLGALAGIGWHVAPRLFGIDPEAMQAALRHADLVHDAEPIYEPDPRAIPHLDPTGDPDGFIKGVASLSMKPDLSPKEAARLEKLIGQGFDLWRDHDVIREAHIRGYEQRDVIMHERYDRSLTPEDYESLEKGISDNKIAWARDARESTEYQQWIGRLASVVARYRSTATFRNILDYALTRMKTPVPETTIYGDLIPKTPQGLPIREQTFWKMSDGSIFAVKGHTIDGRAEGLQFIEPRPGAFGGRITTRKGPGVFDGANQISEDDAFQSVKRWGIGKSPEPTGQGTPPQAQGPLQLPENIPTMGEGGSPSQPQPEWHDPTPSEALALHQDIPELANLAEPRDFGPAPQLVVPPTGEQVRGLLPPGNIPGGAIEMEQLADKAARGYKPGIRGDLIHSYYRAGEKAASIIGDLRALSNTERWIAEDQIAQVFKADKQFMAIKSNRQMFNAALLGDAHAFSYLPAPIQKLTSGMINDVYRMESLRMQMGLLEPSTVAKRFETTGLNYLRREYSSVAFSKDYHKIINQQQDANGPLWSKTFDYIRADPRSARLSDQAIEAAMHELIQRMPDRTSTPFKEGDVLELGKKAYADSTLHRTLGMQRGEIPDQIRHFMGEIDDGAYIAARTMALTQGDLHRFSLYNEIAKDNNLSRSVGNPDLKGFTQLKGGRDQWGPLSGRFVKNEIYEQLSDSNMAQGWSNDLLNRLTADWKWGKIVFDAKSWVHRFLHNSAFSSIAGLVPWRPAELLYYTNEATRSLLDFHTHPEVPLGTAVDPALKDIQFRRQNAVNAIQHGILYTETGNTEWYNYARALERKLQIVPQRSGVGGLLDALRDTAAAGKEFSSKGYDMIDQVPKMAAYLKNRDEAFMKWRFDPTVAQIGPDRYAAMKVNQAFPNHAMVPRVVDWMRKHGPVFNPVIAFRSELLRIGATTAMRAAKEPEVPLRLLMFLGGLKAAGTYLQKYHGISDAEVEAANAKMTPASQATAPLRTLLPTKDDKGRSQFYDWSRIALVGSFLMGDSNTEWYNRVAHNVLMEPFSSGLIGNLSESAFPSLRMFQQRPDIPAGVDPLRFSAFRAYEALAPGLIEDTRMAIHSAVDESTLKANPLLGITVGSRDRLTEEQLTPGQAAGNIIGFRRIPVSDQTARGSLYRQTQNLQKDIRSIPGPLMKGPYPVVGGVPMSIEDMRKRAIEQSKKEGAQIVERRKRMGP